MILLWFNKEKFIAKSVVKKVRIRRIRLYNIEFPLARVYKVAYRDVTHIPLVVAVVNTEDREVYGETYQRQLFWEPKQDPWEFCIGIAPYLIGLDVDGAKEKVLSSPLCFPRSSQGLLTALDQLLEPEIFSIEGSISVPLVGTVMSFDDDGIRKDVSILLEKGYRTLKVKVGFELEADLKRIELIQGLIGNKAVIRVDANQGYTFEEAEEFVKSVDPGSIQLFEQPFGVTKWDEMARLNLLSPVPLMLDESIYNEEDINRTITLNCASYVKLKLIKCHGYSRLKEIIKYGQQKGLRVVLGNGASADLSCLFETLMVNKLLIDAGENNGFLKISGGLLRDQLGFKDGNIVIPDGFQVGLNSEVLKSHAVDARDYY